MNPPGSDLEQQSPEHKNLFTTQNIQRCKHGPRIDVTCTVRQACRRLGTLRLGRHHGNRVTKRVHACPHKVQHAEIESIRPDTRHQEQRIKPFGQLAAQAHESLPRIGAIDRGGRILRLTGEE